MVEVIRLYGGFQCQADCTGIWLQVRVFRQNMGLVPRNPAAGPSTWQDSVLRTVTCDERLIVLAGKARYGTVRILCGTERTCLFPVAARISESGEDWECLWGCLDFVQAAPGRMVTDPGRGDCAAPKHWIGEGSSHMRTGSLLSVLRMLGRRPSFLQDRR